MDKRSRDEKMSGAATAPSQGRPSGRPLPPPKAPPPPPRPRFEPVDREKTCPLLLRVFTKVGGHHTDDDFAIRGKEPKDEVQIYTWKDATLRELTDLVKEVAPEARRRNAKLSFAFVYPDKRGRFVLKQVGMTHSYGNGRRLDDSKALGELDFQVSFIHDEYSQICTSRYNVVQQLKNPLSTRQGFKYLKILSIQPWRILVTA